MTVWDRYCRPYLTMYPPIPHTNIFNKTDRSLKHVVLVLLSALPASILYIAQSPPGLKNGPERNGMEYGEGGRAVMLRVSEGGSEGGSEVGGGGIMNEPPRMGWDGMGWDRESTSIHPSIHTYIRSASIVEVEVKVESLCRPDPIGGSTSTSTAYSNSDSDGIAGRGLGLGMVR